MATGRNRAASSAGSAPSQQTNRGKKHKLKQDRINKKRREARHRAKERAWYILVRGIAPGLYSSWEEVERQIAASVAAGFHDPRAYRYKSRMEALEGFLRWWNGKRVYPSRSTMLTRKWQYLPAKFLEFKGVAQAYAVMCEMRYADEKAKLRRTQEAIRASVYDATTDETSSNAPKTHAEASKPEPTAKATASKSKSVASTPTVTVNMPDVHGNRPLQPPVDKDMANANTSVETFNVSIQVGSDGSEIPLRHDGRVVLQRGGKRLAGQPSIFQSSSSAIYGSSSEDEQRVEVTTVSKPPAKAKHRKPKGNTLEAFGFKKVSAGRRERDKVRSARELGPNSSLAPRTQSNKGKRRRRRSKRPAPSPIKAPKEEPTTPSPMTALHRVVTHHQRHLARAVRKLQMDEVADAEMQERIRMQSMDAPPQQTYDRLRPARYFEDSSPESMEPDSASSTPDPTVWVNEPGVSAGNPIEVHDSQECQREDDSQRSPEPDSEDYGINDDCARLMRTAMQRRLTSANSLARLVDKVTSVDSVVACIQKRVF